MTSDSISTSPRISAPRMSPAAPGLRAIASAAALTPRPCASAPRPAANARANPAVMIDHLATSVWLMPPPVGSWANTGANTPAAITSANVRTERLLTTQASSEQLPKRVEPNAERMNDYASRGGGGPTPLRAHASRPANDDAHRRRPRRDGRRPRLPAGK